MVAANSIDYYSGWATPPNGGAAYRLHVYAYVAGQDVGANQTLIAFELRLEKDRSFNGFYGYSATFAGQIDGADVFNSSGTWPDAAWTGWSGWPVGSGYITVTHGTNGTKTVSVHAEYTGANSGWAIGAIGLTQDWELPPIARATVPKVTPSPATVGSTVTIDLPRVVGSYTHDVTWESGTLSGTIGTGLGTSTTWTVPSVMGEFPGKAQGSIVIKVVTKNGATVIGTRQVTLFARTAPSIIVGPNLNLVQQNPDKQFDIRARRVVYSGGEWKAMSEVPVSTISMVDPASATATCTVDVSGLIATDFSDDEIIDIDVFNGTDWVYTNHRFVLARSDGDEIDPSKMKNYSGTEFIDHVLAGAYTQVEYVWGEEGFAGVTTPGEMMRLAITDAKARGWGPRVDFEFTAGKTSFGEGWANSGLKRRIGKGTPLSQMLQGLVEDGLVEYRAEYRSNKAWLVLMNPGTGSDYSVDGSVPIVNFNLAKLSRAPRRGDRSKRITTVTVAGDDDVQVTRRTTAFDSDVFGSMEGWVSASGITDATEANRIGDAALADNSAPTNERTFEYEGGAVAPVFFPYYVFIPGDWVKIPDVDSSVTDRISQVTISKTEDKKTLTILTGDRILSGNAKIAKRQAAQTGGSIGGGNQSSPSPLDSRIPAEVVVSSITSAGYWGTDGNPRSKVTLTWAAVTTALSGGPITCDLYEVFWRDPVSGNPWTFIAMTAALTIDLPDWEVNKALEFRVRARSVAGIYGAFSANQTHTTATPAVNLLGPVLADLYTDGVGSIYAVWNGILGAAPYPLRMAYVGAEISTDAGVTYNPTGTTLPTAGTIVINPEAWGTFRVRLRPYDKLGNPGTAGAYTEITLVDPGINPATPAAPTGLVATAGAAWNPDGINLDAWIDLDWNDVTLDLGGQPVAIVGYDIWGKKSTDSVSRFITSSQVSNARIPVAQGETWGLEVRAVSDLGGISDFSTTIIDTADAAVSAPSAPDAPTLEQYAGLLKVKWSGNGMVPQVRYAFISISSDAVNYIRMGMPLIGAGEGVIANLPALPTGTVYRAKINIVDELGQIVSSPASAPITLLPPTGITIQTSSLASRGVKLTDAGITAYNGSGVATFILNASTGEVFIAAYDTVFDLGASGLTAEGGLAVNGLAVSDPSNAAFNTFFHPSGIQIRNDQTALSWWEADPSDGFIINFFSPRAYIKERLRVGDFEHKKEDKGAGASRLVTRYKGA